MRTEILRKQPKKSARLRESKEKENGSLTPPFLLWKYSEELSSSTKQLKKKKKDHLRQNFGLKRKEGMSAIGCSSGKGGSFSPLLSVASSLFFFKFATRR